MTADLHKDENRVAHRTDDYEMQELIVRRGQTFDVTVTFDRGYNPEVDIIVVQFVTGTEEWLFYLKGIVSWLINHIVARYLKISSLFLIWWHWAI